MRTTSGYRFLLRRAHGITGPSPNRYPNTPCTNAVLKNQGEVDERVEKVREIGLTLCEE